jgi:hypothetical protein
MRLAGELWIFWWIRGNIGEGRGWLAWVLAGEGGPPAVHARALNGAGVLAWTQGEYGQAVTLHKEALAL